MDDEIKTVGDLKRALQSIPDDLPIVSLDGGGYPMDGCYVTDAIWNDRYLSNRNGQRVCSIHA